MHDHEYAGTGDRPGGFGTNRVVLISVVTIVGIAVAFGALQFRQAYTYYAGAETTAQVTRCEDRAGKSTRTVCEGAWMVDGSRYEGRVYGVGKSDVGDTVEVRATKESASTLDTPGSMLRGLLLLPVLAGVSVAARVVLRRRRSRLP